MNGTAFRLGTRKKKENRKKDEFYWNVSLQSLKGVSNVKPRDIQNVDKIIQKFLNPVSAKSTNSFGKYSTSNFYLSSFFYKWKGWLSFLGLSSKSRQSFWKAKTVVARFCSWKSAVNNVIISFCLPKRLSRLRTKSPKRKSVFPFMKKGT